MELTQMAYNYKKSVDWVMKAYSDAGVDFPNGFQKDSIQNAVGAKIGNKWKNWKCDISYIKNDCGEFIVVEDFGTTGLTGANTPVPEVNKMIAAGGTLPPEERLSRFTSMFTSGGNTGPGLYGAGKSVYAVASKDYAYYFDSLRIDGVYIADINKSGQVMPTALTGDEGKQYIKENTGLDPKTTTGTRIIITNPNEELVESIVSGSIIPYIQESWWLIIQRLDENSCISVNGVPVSIPEHIKETPYAQEINKTDVINQEYKVKHFGLYVFPDSEPEWSGISYYRKGMKIGQVNLREVPKKYIGKFWGYVEVDEPWEEALSLIEDGVHFGISNGKRNRAPYQNLINYCSEKFHKMMTEWGFIKDKENADKKLKDQLKQISEEVQDLFDKLGYEDLGRGPQKSDFDIRWQDIHYPVEGTEEVTSGDVISFAVRITSFYSIDKRFDYKLTINNPKTGDVISTIASEKVLIKPDSILKKEYSLKISQDTAERFAENRVVLSVTVIGSGKKKTRELPFFYDIEKPDNSRDNISLKLHECIFPRETSRRVNFDEAIRSVIYRVENKRNHILKCKLNVSIHNASVPSCPKIVDIASFNGEVAPFEDILTPPIDEIVFSKETYEPYMTEGILELRARLIAAEDDEQYEKGDRITFYNYKIYLNTDEKNGKKDSFDTKSKDDPEDPRRSWCEPGTGRTITINVGHMAYQSLADYPEIQNEYLREQVMRQFVLLYLAEGKFDMFGNDGEDFRELEPQEAVDRVMTKIENVYYQSLR